jgi:hypothetical protein
LIILIATGGLWFILQIAIGNYTIIQDFITYQIRLLQTKDAGHGGFLLYHFVIVFFGVFPASAFAIPAHRFLKTRKDQPYWLFIFMMISLLWAVLIVFTIVKTKIVHYSSLTYFPITFLAAYYLNELICGRIKLGKTENVLLLISGSIFSLGLLLVASIGNFKKQILEANLIKDKFAIENLQANVVWNGTEFLIGLLVVAAIALFYWYKNESVSKSVYYLFALNVIAVFFAAIVITPKVEGYSQRAMIEFLEEHSEEDVYFNPLFKSYAHYFYGTVQPYNEQKAYSNEWLRKGKIDKDAYFIGKIHREEQYLKNYPDFKKIGEKNGFVFFKRDGKKH